MLTKKLILAVVVIVLIIGAVFFLLTAKQQKKIVVKPVSQKLTKLKIGIIPIASLLQYYVAKEKGYFKEEGLDIEAVSMAGGADIAPAVASGALNIGWSNIGSIILAHVKNFDFQYIIGGSFKNLGGPDFQEFLVSSDSTITKPKDLEGKKMAIPTAGRLMDLLFNEWSAKNGVDVKKIQIVEVPSPQMEAALKNKQIDGGVFNEPYVALTLAHGVGKVFDASPFDAVAKKYMVSSWFVKKSWSDANPQIVLSFKKAIEKSTKYINEHSEELNGIVARNTKIDKTIIGKMIQPRFDTVISKNDIQPIIDGFAKYKFIDKAFPAQEIVDKNLILE